MISWEFASRNEFISGFLAVDVAVLRLTLLVPAVPNALVDVKVNWAALGLHVLFLAIQYVYLVLPRAAQSAYKVYKSSM